MFKPASPFISVNKTSYSNPLNNTGITALRSQGGNTLRQFTFARCVCFLFFLIWTGYASNAFAKTALVNDGVVSSSISVAGGIDEFIFQANAGDAVHIRASDVSALRFTLEPEVWLYSPDGTLISHDSDFTAAAVNCNSSSNDCQINQTGTYRLVVADQSGDDTGDIDIHFAKVPGSENSRMLINDKVVKENLSRGDIDTFVFEATAGDAVHIRAGDTSASGSLILDAWYIPRRYSN